MNCLSFSHKLDNLDRRIKTIADNRDVIADIMYAMVEDSNSTLIWYAALLRNCCIEYNQHIDFPMAVYFNQVKNKFIIIVNKYLTSILSNQEMIALLKHEFGHVFQMHFEREWNDDYGLHVQSLFERKMLNIAMDFTINGSRKKPFIKNIPGSKSTYINGKVPPLSGIFCSDLRDMYHYEVDISGKETYDKFYTILMDIYQTEKSIKIDNNEFLQRLSRNEIEDLLEQKAKRYCQDTSYLDLITKEEITLIKKAKEIILGIAKDGFNHGTISSLEDTNAFLQSTKDDYLNDKLIELRRLITEATRSHGSMPSELINIVIEIDKKIKGINWTVILRRAIKSSLNRCHAMFSYQRQNKILPDDPSVPGVKKIKKTEIGVVVDVSGSIGQNQLSEFINEISLLAQKLRSSINIVQVDTEIKKIEKINSKQKYIERCGNGGSNMEEGFIHFLNLPFHKRPNIIICFTDGNIEERFKKITFSRNIDVIFVLPQNNTLTFDRSIFERSTVIFMKQSA